MTGSHPHEDDLVALALDDLEPQARERALRHVSWCSGCRLDYDDLARAVEDVLAVAPPVEPPAGFEARVLSAMGFGPETDVPRRRSWLASPGRRRGMLVAASVIGGLTLGVAGTYVVQDRDTAPAAAPPPAGTVTLRTDAGQAVGTVTPSTLGRRTVLVLSVHSAKAGMHYLCRLRLGDGRRVDAATWVLDSRSGTWVVEAPATEVDEVALVAHDGRGPVWSRADL